MTAPLVRGWCPGAFRPMESGDGWIVRVNPPGGRLTATQAAGLAAAAEAHGNGWIDLTSRASLQIRGVRLAAHPALLDDLATLGLLPPGGRDLPGIVVTPFWSPGDGVQDTAAALSEALSAAGLSLPGKFGFAVDHGDTLAATPADIRIDAARVPPATAVPAALALARAYLARIAGLPRPPRMHALSLAGTVAGVSPDGSGDGGGRAGLPPGPGPVAQGTLAALAFGQLRAGTLARLGALRLTPWRMVLVEGAIPPDPALITDPTDPLLRVIACPGAPFCPQGQAPTRDLARRLASRVSAGSVLHVSGCAKGCARSQPADIVLTARDGLWDLAHDGRAGDPPARTGLSMAELEEPDALRL
jgi:precorrin-3B synthase